MALPVVNITPYGIRYAKNSLCVHPLCFLCYVRSYLQQTSTTLIIFKVKHTCREKQCESYFMFSTCVAAGSSCVCEIICAFSSLFFSRVTKGEYTHGHDRTLAGRWSALSVAWQARPLCISRCIVTSVQRCEPTIQSHKIKSEVCDNVQQRFDWMLTRLL